MKKLQIIAAVAVLGFLNANATFAQSEIDEFIKANSGFDSIAKANDVDATIGSCPNTVVNALPITPETTGIYDAKFYATAKPGARFINVDRGKSVVTADLTTALRSGQIAGADLYVSDPEPLPADRGMWQMNNVLITPHVAGNGSSSNHQMLVPSKNCGASWPGKRS